MEGTVRTRIGGIEKVTNNNSNETKSHAALFENVLYMLNIKNNPSTTLGRNP